MAFSKRRKGRQMAVQMLYQHDLGGASVSEILHSFQPNGYAENEAEGSTRKERVEEAVPVEELQGVLEYAARLLEGSTEHREEIDTLIASQAENWRLERMPAVDRNILRLAVYELLYEDDVPHLVVLDEAIELAKEFGSEQSGRFINGLLDGLIRSHELPGNLK